jgi:hypothetical protein
LARPKQMSWGEIVAWSFASGFGVLVGVAAIMACIYTIDGGTRVWFDGLSAVRLALYCAIPWVLTFWAVFGFLVKVRFVENESVAKVGDFIDKSWRR